MKEIKDLTLSEKVDLLKELVNELDIVVLGCYGSSANVFAQEIHIAAEADKDYNIVAGQTVLIHTDICSD